MCTSCATEGSMRIARFLLVTGLLVSTALQGCSTTEWEEVPEDKVVENRPGSLVITSPSRGALIEAKDAPIEIRGKGASARLKINGERPEVEADGTFHTTIKPKTGL